MSLGIHRWGGAASGYYYPEFHPKSGRLSIGKASQHGSPRGDFAAVRMGALPLQMQAGKPCIISTLENYPKVMAG